MMKKQILPRCLLLLAVFAGMNDLYGQAVHHSAPEAPVSCTNDPLHPMAGVPYTYSVTTSPSGGDYIWWATTDPNFITSGGLQNNSAGLLTSPDVISTVTADYNTSTTASSIELTWGTDVLAAATSTPTFVAVHYDNSTSGCSDNLKVYKIDPINAFTVDILNLDPTTIAPGASGYSYAASQCYDEVQGAKWTSGGMVYDYGTNILYFEVVAANFTEEWTPTFTLSGLNTGQTAKIEWAYDTTFGTATTVTSGTASSVTAKTNETNTSKGVSIFVKVTVTNGTYEGVSDDSVTLAVNGTNTANQSDVKASDCSGPDTNEATQTLTARPAVTNNTSGGTFE
jgi:hypothetical protein